MTTVTSQYRTFVANMRRITGLGVNEIGVAPDASHLAGGGYHVGPADIRAIGRWDKDYSTRQPRDRIGGNNASAFDIGDDWPNGGRSAWLRFNNLLLRQLRDGDPALPSLRAINFSPDGSARRRYDTNNRGQGVISSTDTVYMHTHGEVWRDQAGTAALDTTFRRIEQIAEAAISGQSLGVEMSDITPADTNLWTMARRAEALFKHMPATVADPGIPSQPNGLYAAMTALAAQVTAMRTILDTVLAQGGNVDTATILTAMDTKLEALAQEQRDAVADLGEGGASQVRADA